MTLNRTNTLLAILLFVSVLGTAATRVDYSKPNIEILPDMKYTPAWMAFERNPHFANGQTLQMPVPGTIARGQSPLYFTSTKEDALRAGVELVNPYADADREASELQESIRRGGDTYRVFCISCHGAAGAGDGPVAKRGFPPPPSLVTGNSTKMKDGQLFHIVSYGQGSMAGFPGQLSHAQSWDAVNFVRSLQPALTRDDEHTDTDQPSAQTLQREEQE
jgi:mono/diheme cytochrome c family protein